MYQIFGVQQTVEIQPGVYTENLTLHNGIALVGVEGNVDTLGVQIIGTHTPDPTNGVSTFREINFYGSPGSPSIFSSSAAGQGYLSFEECNWILQSTGYIFDMQNWVGPTGLVTGPNALAIMGCGDLSTAVSGFARNSAGMNMALINSYIGSYTTDGTLPLQCSGRLQISISDVYCPIQISGSASSFIEDCGLHGIGVTVSATSQGYIANNIFSQLTSAAFTMNSAGAWSISSTTIDTSAGPAITGTGAGLLTLGGITFLQNSSVAPTLNVIGANGFIAGQYTNHGVVLGQGSNALQSTNAGTNGQVLIAATSNNPAFASLTSTGGTITFTTGVNSLNLEAATGTVTWTDVTGATQTLAVENGYVTDRGGGVTYTLPATATLGQQISIVGKAGLATIAQNANQQILIGSASSTVGVGGSVAATNAGDCINLICITAGASTVWRANSLVGNWTVT